METATILKSFWRDPKVYEDFTPEDRYFYLYLLTNEHTNISGCYEIGISQISAEMGYTEDIIKKLIKRFETVHKVAKYYPETREMLLKNYGRYNWTKSPKIKTAVLKVAEHIKNRQAKAYVLAVLEGKVKEDPLMEIPPEFDNPHRESEDIEPEEKKKEQKHKYGPNKKVLMTDREHELLVKKLGEVKARGVIDYFDLYLCDKPYKSKSHYAAMVRWVIDAFERSGKKRGSPLYEAPEIDNSNPFKDYMEEANAASG